MILFTFVWLCFRFDSIIKYNFKDRDIVLYLLPTFALSITPKSAEGYRQYSITFSWLFIEMSIMYYYLAMWEVIEDEEGIVNFIPTVSISRLESEIEEPE